MLPNDERNSSPRSAAAQFQTTRWSLVLAAVQGDASDSKQALATLCETYWYPLYAYVRRRGYGTHDAQDLTQEFFATLLEKQSLRVADRQRGRFRSFLLSSLNHFLANEWRRASAQKRGGQRAPLSLDFDSGERRYSLEPSHELTPEKIYQRRWAMTLLGQALSKLRQDFSDRGKLELFENLKPFLGGEQKTVPYRKIAAKLEMTEGAVKVAVHRMRGRCRELLREEVAQTVAESEEIDGELRDLFASISP